MPGAGCVLSAAACFCLSVVFVSWGSTAAISACARRLPADSWRWREKPFAALRSQLGFAPAIPPKQGSRPTSRPRANCLAVTTRRDLPARIATLLSKKLCVVYQKCPAPRKGVFSIFAEGIFETHGADQVPTAAVLPRIPDQPGLDKAAEDLLSYKHVLRK